jgi:hypothetical protein
MSRALGGFFGIFWEGRTRSVDDTMPMPPPRSDDAPLRLGDDVVGDFGLDFVVTGGIAANIKYHPGEVGSVHSIELEVTKPWKIPHKVRLAVQTKWRRYASSIEGTTKATFTGEASKSLLGVVARTKRRVCETRHHAHLVEREVFASHVAAALPRDLVVRDILQLATHDAQFVDHGDPSSGLVHAQVDGAIHTAFSTTTKKKSELDRLSAQVV